MEERVVLNGETYEFSNQIGEDKETFQSFNELGRKTFGLWFHKVGGDYEPHVLKQGNKVCANISVNQIRFIDHGQSKFYIQLGTVMTEEEYRHKGLSRFIMEWILKKWQGKCDAIYLFGNDSVLDFYPKFGFVDYDEYEYSMSDVETDSTLSLEKLNMDDTKVQKYVWEKYMEGNPYASFYMIENEPIFTFYYEEIKKNNVYIMNDGELVVVVEEEDGKLILSDVLGKTELSLQDVTHAVAAQFKQKEITLGFTPIKSEGLICNLHKEEDCTLFIHTCGEALMKEAKMMFPLLSHA